MCANTCKQQQQKQNASREPWLFYTKKKKKKSQQKVLEEIKKKHFIMGQGTIHQKIIKIANIFTHNKGISKLTNTKMRGEINKSSVTLEDFNELFSVFEKETVRI